MENQTKPVYAHDLHQLLIQKDRKTNTLNLALNNLVALQNEYAEASNKLWVETNFNEVIVEGRPTVDMKKAYIDKELAETVSKINVEKTNIEILGNELKCIDTKIKAELKYLDIACKNVFGE